MAKSVNEIWKEVEGTNGQYMVSNLGRIKSVYTDRACHGKIIRIAREKLVKPFDNGNGYVAFGVCINGKKKNIYVHRAVATAFLPRPEDKPYINHKDYNRANNCIENLEWCSCKENIGYSRQNMCKPHTSKSNTSEKYICHKKNGYEVNLRFVKVSKRFKTLDEAVCFRNEVLCEYGIAI